MKVFVTGGSGFIGTNLIGPLVELGHSVCNFDRTEPFDARQRDFWLEGELLDATGLLGAMSEFKPDWVVHLAARAECDENTTVEEGYQVNTTGTQILLDAIKKCPSVRRLIMTSSQYVCGPRKMPEGDEDFFPDTVYGQSKVETERLTRQAGLPCCWTIIRPTNVWGPWHMRYAGEFWKIVDKGWYFHPAVPSPTRSYAYVGNMVWQVLRILELDEEMVTGKVLYVGDRPINIQEWIEGFHREITGKKRMRRIPFWGLKAIGVAGDMISAVIRRPFYITTSRLRSMTTDYLTPMDPTFDLLGTPPSSLEEGIAETVKWFREWKKPGSEHTTGGSE